MQSSEPHYPESYNQAEIRQILELALTRQIKSSSLTREELWAMGTKLGLDLLTIQEAEKHWLEQKAINLQRQEFNLDRRQQLINRITRFAIINGIIVVLDLLTTHSLSWSLYLIVIWGLSLGLDAWKTAQTSGYDYEQAFQRWQVRQELKSSLTIIREKWKQAWQKKDLKDT